MVARDASSSNTVLMLSSSKLKFDVMAATHNKDYGNVNAANNQATDQPTNSTPSSSNHVPPPVPIELTIKPPKGVIHKTAFNPHLRATRNYNVIEELA